MRSATPFGGCEPALRFVSMRGSCSPSTCIACGACQKATPTSPAAGAIKIAFAKSLPACEPRSAVTTNRGERGIWQRRYWEHTIRDQRDFARHFDYIHFNPVKHGLVEHPADWPYSTFRRCVASGMYLSGWAGAVNEPAQTGERA
jgi:ferredoxin